MRTVYIIVGTIVAAGLALTGAHAATNCTEATSGNVFVVAAGFATGFNPTCVIIASGQSIKWTNGDVGPFSAHNPASADAPLHQCFMATRDQGGQALETGGEYTVQFSWTGSTLTSTHAGADTTCSASSPTTYTVANGRAQIPYVCTFHSDMVGTIVVKP